MKGKNILQSFKEQPFMIFHTVLFLLFVALAVYDTCKGGHRAQWVLAVAAVVLLFDLLYSMRRQKREYEETIQQMKRSNHFKTMLLSHMSRDVRTPMNAIVGFADLALKKDTGMEEMRDYMGRIRASGIHLLSIIEDVVEFSRVEGGDVKMHGEVVNLPELMHHIMDITYSRADIKNQSVSLEIGYLPEQNVICDRRMLEQILMNITYNAIRYTQDDAKIDVGIMQLGPSDSDTAVYEFSIKDSGIAVSTERVHQIRDIFEHDEHIIDEELDDFGLMIAKKLVDAMGGLIEFEFYPDKGMEIFVTFEMRVSGGETAALKSEPIADYSGRRVLIADDMMINRQIVSAILGVYGIKTDEARDGKEALEALSEKGPGYYDVVLMDIQMPRLDGCEACRRIRALPDKALANVPVIAMTAIVFDEDKRRAYEAGMTGFIPKPVDREELMEKLAQVFEGGGKEH